MVIEYGLKGWRLKGEIMRVFKVDVQERDGDKRNFDLIFKTQDELARFIGSLDMDKYNLTWVDTLENYTEDTTEFLTKVPGLELGQK